MFKFKNLLIIFAIIFFVSFLVLMIVVTKTDESLKSSGRKYVDEVLPLILKTMDYNIFLKHASPEFLNAVDKKNVEKIFEVYKKLGKFEKYLGSKGKVKTSLSFKSGKIIYGNFKAAAIFNTGKAEIKITIINHNGEWFIYYFKINSKIFDKLAKTKNEIK